jgi:hypothetical protein
LPRVTELGTGRGTDDGTGNGWLGLVLSFFAGLHSLYYQYELNLIWAHLGHPAEGALVAVPGSVAPAGTGQAARSGGAPSPGASPTSEG